MFVYSPAMERAGLDDEILVWDFESTKVRDFTAFNVRNDLQDNDALRVQWGLHEISGLQETRPWNQMLFTGVEDIIG